MKILLTNLPKQFETKDFTTPDYFLDNFMKYPPLGLLAIATGVDQKHSLEILDTTVKETSLEDIVAYVKEKKPDILGLTVVTRRLYGMYWITQEIKKNFPNIKIIAGGPHVNYFPRETIGLGYVDYAIAGWCEKSFPQLIEIINNGAKEEDLRQVPNLYYKAGGKIINNPPGPELFVLDELPFPNRKLINLYDYYTAADKEPMTTTYSSRGCPNQCIYCDVQEKKWHYRSAKNVVDEFEEISKMGIKLIHIFDDTFNIDRQRVIDICNEIIKRKLRIKWTTRGRVAPFDEEMASLFKKSGGVRWYVGVETLDPEIMKYIRKGITIPQVEKFFQICKKYKIETMAYLMIGFNKETEEYRKSLYKKAMRLKPTYIFFNVLCPLPKTVYYKEALERGDLKEDFWAKFVRNPVPDFKIPYPRSEKEQKELIRLSDIYSRKFYLNPIFIAKEFGRSLFYPKILFFKIKGGFFMVYKIFLKKLK
ncbi:MAG: Radical SAM domain protein [Candidatus Magasanikbacteria bacterium GW2011_GWA2_42_32]|uniref:Radical SAM domain protein n=1 Tax=Candidatus Magasanikbacteria bacterium GW2011_GWA2_42_32 TaxID=1619039 RepID=A0A0G1A6V3_9BACT|nr:MAG: Radical SAM domain protein [Candidatus Magasanikbacteria bacterium GW2011_GWA2_42_32]